MNEMLGQGRRALRRAFGIVRDGWLIVGIALVGLVCLNAVYRLQGVARDVVRGKPERLVLPPNHPYSREPWYPVFEDGKRSLGVHTVYDPYRGWWGAPYRSRYINVDSAGRRVTIEPPGVIPKRRLLLFGGSAMWGVTARDSFTIPSLVAAELAARGIRDVDIVNMGQVAFTITQEAISLLLELRAGRVPSVVIFFDGSNDISTSYETGRVGTVFSQAIFARRFESDRRGFWTDVLRLGRHSALLQQLARVFASLAHKDQPARPASNALCHEVASSYGNTVRSIEGLGQEFGFAPIFFWQPVFAMTHKPLTVWEDSLRTWPGYRDTVRRCSADVDSLMANRSERTYHPLHDLFDQDTSSVYLDDEGHVTEAANGVIAARIAVTVLPVLSQARAAFDDRHPSLVGASPRN